MDEVIIKHYRGLLRNGFKYAGSFENPSIFLDSVGENIPVCGQIGKDYIHLYINVSNGKIDAVRYLCSCPPTANVALEALCQLVEGETLAEASTLSAESFSELIGSRGEDFVKKAEGLVKLLNRGIERYKLEVA